MPTWHGLSQGGDIRLSDTSIPDAVDRRMQEGIKPEDLARDIAALIDSNDARILANFQTGYPRPDHAKWMLADRKGNSYTAAPLRTGEWGDVEFKTVFEPDYDKKTYLDKFSWGGPRLPFMFTMGLAPWRSITQPPGLSAVSRPYQKDKLHQINGKVNNSAVWPIQAPDGRLIWRADTPEAAPQEQGLERSSCDPIDGIVAPVGMTTMAGKALATAADPLIAYGTDKALDALSSEGALGALLGMFQRSKDNKNGGGGV